MKEQEQSKLQKWKIEIRVDVSVCRKYSKYLKTENGKITCILVL